MKKKLLALLLTVLTAFCAIAPAYATMQPESLVAPSSTTWTTVNETVWATTTVNVRKGPGTGYEIVGKLYKGELVQRTAIGSNGWSKVKYDGDTRYVYSKYLTTNNPDKTIVFAKSKLNIYKATSTSSAIARTLNKGDAVLRISKASDEWSKVEYHSGTGYIQTSKLSTSYPYDSPHYPLRYYDKTAKITITEEKYQQQNSYTWCYVAHLQFSQYSRFSSGLAYGKYPTSNGQSSWETTMHAAKRLGAILCVSGDDNRSGGIVKHSIVFRDTDNYHGPAGYNAYTGKLFYARFGSAYEGEKLSTLVEQHKITDSFNPLWRGLLIRNGEIKVSKDENPTYDPRCFMGTNEKAGDIYVVVTNGCKNDGVSPGLTSYQCAELLQNKGCTFGIPLDSGKRATMVYMGMMLNAAQSPEQGVLDFIYFK